MIYQSHPVEKATVLLFTTDLMHSYDVHQVSSKLNQLSSLLKWTVDLFDWERVLRVETTDVSSKKLIEKALRKEGYHCKELNH